MYFVVLVILVWSLNADLETYSNLTSAPEVLLIGGLTTSFMDSVVDLHIFSLF